MKTILKSLFLPWTHKEKVNYDMANKNETSYDGPIFAT